MTTNREVFSKDPTQYTIPNDGVAEVINPQTDAQWNVLRYELANFVCEGEYKRGLEIILSTYLAHLNREKQPAVWVSGFYGSGKSHFVRVLEYLWRDTVFPPDNVRARDLAKLPDDIKDFLRELTTIGKRDGGLWSAAGTFGAGAGGNVRLALLGILFRSAGLPEQYAPARLAIWLKQEGYYEDVKAMVERTKPDFFRELNNMYASRVLAESLLAVYPEYARDQIDARNIFRAQYPPAQQEISDDEMLRTMEDVLKLQSNLPGKLPYTLIVCDELQQFIGQDSNRTFEVQTVVETCCSHFGTRLLFVATGQASVTGTPQLQKLQGRFTNQVMLSDADVEQVVRRVVLSKKSSEINSLQDALTAVSGEIDRHLAGTRIGPRSDDSNNLVQDYPLLPVRSRFWELFLRNVDSSGTTGQLRTQLRITHEAIKDIAYKPLGTVVAGDVIYKQLKINMLQSSMLLSDVEIQITQLDNGTPDGELSARLCIMVFLIGKLPVETLKDSGIRSDINTLADLLVEDLIIGSAPLRQRIPDLLQKLVDDRILMQVGDEYRIQTREGKEWESEYHRRYERALSDDVRLTGDRTTEFQRVVKLTLKSVSSLLQGQSKTTRKLDLHFGPEFPVDNTGMIPLWVRDGWSVSEKTVREDAQRAGVKSPVVFVFLPKLDTDAIKDALASYAAADETIAVRTAANTVAGQEAKLSMQSRVQMAQNKRDMLIENIVQNARVYQGGGNDVDRGTFLASVKAAVDDALIRLFPSFSLGDHPGWGTVVKQVREGNTNALMAVAYSGNVEDQAVCKEVRSYVDTLGKKGSDIRKHFMGGSYGWPQDAVDGALLCLVAGGFLRATRNSIPVNIKEIATQVLGLTEFFKEGTTVTAAHRINIRALLTGLGFPVKQGEEVASIPRILSMLHEAATAAGGNAPLPEKPSTSSIDRLQALSGNELVVAVSDQLKELLDSFKVWKDRQDQIAKRLPEWEKLQQFLAHTRSLPITLQVEPQVKAIRDGRYLLFDPDPILPLIDDLRTALRGAIMDFQQRRIAEQNRQIQTLDAWAEWPLLSVEERLHLLSQNGLGSIPELKIETDEELLETLAANPISSWEDKISTPQARVVKVREATMKLRTPDAIRISPPPVTLTSSSEIDAYLTQLRIVIMKHLDAGNQVVV